VILRRVLPTPIDEVALDAAGARARLLEWYAPNAGESLRLNFVATLDGRVTGDDGTSHSLTAGADRMILGVIREHADVILVGAQTVRAEAYRLPRRTPIAIVTATGDLSGHGFEPREDAPAVLVLAPKGATEAAHSSLGEVPHEVVALDADPSGASATEIVAALRERGMTSIVCEGGPSLAAQLLSAHMVDEVCLTTVPRLGGSGIRLLGDDSEASNWVPRQLVLDDDGVQYARWRRAATP
jgi:riboflavin biosynthesis pyrimidine reductase